MSAPASNITWIENPGLYAALVAAGHSVIHYSTGAWSPDPTPTQDFINAYSAVPFVQHQALEALAAQLAKVIAAGFTYQTVLVAVDDASIGKITAQAAVASNTIHGLLTTAWPSSFAWLPQGAGAPLPLSTPQDMITFAGAVAAYVSNVILYAASLEAKILAATSVSGVEAVTLTTGWPTA
jgi:hypothetical protein